MKFLKAIGLVLAGLLFLIVLISFFLPGSVHLERSITMKTNASTPYQMVNKLEEWHKWSPWHSIDPTAKWEYSDVAEGEGAWYSWKSENPQVGNGKFTILHVVPNESINSQMEFEGMGISHSGFKFEPIAEGVKVIWSMDCDGAGMPWYMKIPSKYFNLFMDKMVGPDYEKGLNSLKTVCESQPQTDRISGFETEEREMGAMKLASVRQTIKTSDLSRGNIVAKWLAQISQAIASQKIKPVGPPMTIYHKYGVREVEVEAAIPVATLGEANGNVTFHEIDPANTLVLKYYGGYANMEPIYIAAYDYIKEKGKTSNGAPMEMYITDPGMEKDTTKWLTEIVFPLDKQ
jgi:effector-binding domain-containing protein